VLGGNLRGPQWLPHYRWRRGIVLCHKICVGPGLRRRDWSCPVFPGEGIMVGTTVRAVGGGCGTAAGDGLGVAALGPCGLLAFVN